MLQTALQFLSDHNEIAFATCKGDFPKLRVFQIMRQEGTIFKHFDLMTGDIGDGFVGERFSKK